MRPVLIAIRPALLACALLSLAVAGGELALRLQGESAGPQNADDADRLTAPCATAFRRLSQESSTSIDPDSGDPIEIVVNSHGLRGPEVAVPKPAGVYRILCLGDETVLGPHVESDQTISARLEHLLQAKTRYRIEVMNAGLPGGCPLLAWLRLRHSLLALQPDLIVLHVDMTDVDDDRVLRRHTRLDADQTPMSCPHPSLVRSGGSRAWWQNCHVIQALSGFAASLGSNDVPATSANRPTATGWIRDSPADWDLYVKQSLAPLDDVQRAAAGTGAMLVVATSPQPWQVAAEASAGPGVREAAGVAPGLVFRSRAPFDAIRSAATDRRILCCDTSVAFRSFPEPARLYFQNASSLSRLGNELYARVLSEHLASHLPVFGADRAADAPTGGTPGTITISRGNSGL